MMMMMMTVTLGRVVRIRMNGTQLSQYVVSYCKVGDRMGSQLFSTYYRGDNKLHIQHTHRSLLWFIATQAICQPDQAFPFGEDVGVWPGLDLDLALNLTLMTPPSLALAFNEPWPYRPTFARLIVHSPEAHHSSLARMMLMSFLADLIITTDVWLVRPKWNHLMSEWSDNDNEFWSYIVWNYRQNRVQE